MDKAKLLTRKSVLYMFACITGVILVCNFSSPSLRPTTNYAIGMLMGIATAWGLLGKQAKTHKDAPASTSHTLWFVKK